MKRIIILSSIIFACASQVSAQITPSSYVIGGSSAFTVASRPSGNNLMSTAFSIRPEFGKFVSDKWLISGGLGYSINNSRTYLSNQKLTNRVQNFSGNFGATRFYPISEKFYFTLEYGLAANYFLSETDVLNGSTVNTGVGKGIGLSIGVSPGLAYFINPKWMLFTRMGQLSYDFSKMIDFDNAVHSLGYNFQGNSLGLGVRYVIGTGK